MSAPSARSLFVRLLQGGKTRWGACPSQFDHDYTRQFHSQLGRLFGPDRYFETEFKGWHNVPDRNVMAVTNHSGGTTLIDMMGLWHGWYAHSSFQRPFHGLAHEMLFANDAIGSTVARLGGVRACRELGVEVLTEWGKDILVAPGGDRDVWRPWRDRYRVNFANRKGYAKLAIRTGTPIMPIAHAGPQSTMMVLTDGSRVARALGIPKIARAEIWPVSLTFPWGLSVGPWPHLPPPTRLRYRIGAPIAPPVRCAPDEEPPADAVDELDRQVQAVIQGMLDELRETSPMRQVIHGASDLMLQWAERKLDEALQAPPPAIIERRASAPARDRSAA